MTRDNIFLLSSLAILAKSFLEIFSTSQIALLRKERMAVGKVAAGKCVVVHDVKKMQQVVQLIRRETAFC